MCLCALFLVNDETVQIIVIMNFEECVVAIADSLFLRTVVSQWQDGANCCDHKF
jgi:hypothetical protein